MNETTKDIVLLGYGLSQVRILGLIYLPTLLAFPTIGATLEDECDMAIWYFYELDGCD